MKKMKNFNGKWYRQGSHHKNKKLAKAKATWVRNKFDYSVRVVKAKKGYDLYIQLDSVLREQYRKHPMGYP